MYFKNNKATEQKFPCVSTAKGIITGVECEPFRLAFSWQRLYFRSFLCVALKRWLLVTFWFSKRFWQQKYIIKLLKIIAHDTLKVV